MLLRIEDNTKNIKLAEKTTYTSEYKYFFDKLACTPVGEFSPTTLGLKEFKDDIKQKTVLDFNSVNDTITTHNVMGFIGDDKTQLTIASRFARDDGADYFLHYMLHKVLALNLVDFEPTQGKDSIWDFYRYLFPKYLKSALNQGIYKSYERRQYNDARIKGSIDIARHLRTNIPFMGKIAYSVREHSTDNILTQLIRHTIEFLRGDSMGHQLLNGDEDMREAVQKICTATPSYNASARQKIIRLNLKPHRHPYFTEYSALQKICLAILQRKKLSYGADKNTISGILFDGALLWEEYLATFLCKKELGFEHPNNRTGVGRHKLFTDGSIGIFPDFIKNADQENCVILDAKYKKIETGNNADYYQLLSYMFRFNSKQSFLIYPSETQDTHGEQSELQLAGKHEYPIKLFKYAMKIPNGLTDFSIFSGAMAKQEEALVEYLNKKIGK